MTNSVIPLPKVPAVAPVPATPASPAPPEVPTLPVQPVQLPTPIIAVATAAPPAGHWQPPVLGSLAVIFGVASLFTGTLVLAPLALALALAAGIFRQISWAVIGGAAATVALATSKYFWALLGLAWLINRVSWLWH
jgi:hypothetical protein